jgi:hypothetical protein
LDLTLDKLILKEALAGSLQHPATAFGSGLSTTGA